MTVADPERFTAKSKSITYTGAFMELYKWRNRGQVYEIHGMVEFEKWHASTASIKATNLRLEVAKEEVQRKQEVVERRKTDTAATKQQRDKGGISLSNEDDDNYYSDTDDMDPE